MKGKNYRVDYEGLRTLFFLCGKFDHINENCPDRTVHNDGVSGSNNEVEVSTGANGDMYGPWTSVKKKWRKK